MEANEITLNPKTDKSANLVCSECGEKVVEVSTENQNIFDCGCDDLVEFEIETRDYTDDRDYDLLDELDISEEDLGDDSLADCWKCGGTGVTSSFIGQYGGTVECKVCGGDGKLVKINRA